MLQLIPPCASADHLTDFATAVQTGCTAAIENAHAFHGLAAAAAKEAPNRLHCKHRAGQHGSSPILSMGP